MKRTKQSVVTRTVSTATHDGWELQFLHESGGTQEGVTCTGHNGSGGNVNAAINNMTPQNSSMNFHGVAHDPKLGTDIFNEMNLILGGGE